MALAIKVENLSKAYQLGEIGTGTLSRDLERWIAKVRGKEDPFLKIGETNDRTSKGKSDIVWSLKDINFEINQGDAVGIIGRNGAGKSTLLKILSRVTSPTTGEINIKGRIASLLEVGTGFHPELTGRENIFLNGAILGMRKKEIKRKFDEIVDFAGVERYIDTPVKRYSSGMYVRLAFAVAAHLESEILIVDEVLAVGDAEFQKKCLGKMGEVSKGEGRTVLFVSHNMTAVQSLCNAAVLLHEGTVSSIGATQSIVQKYLNKFIPKSKWEGCEGLEGIVMKETNVKPSSGNTFIYNNDGVEIELKFSVTKLFPSLVLGFNLISSYGYPVARCLFNDYNNLEQLAIGEYSLFFLIPPNTLAVGTYTLEFDIAIPHVVKLIDEKINLSFSVLAFNSAGNRFNIENNNYYNSLLRPDWFHKLQLL